MRDQRPVPESVREEERVRRKGAAAAAAGIGLLAICALAALARAEDADGDGFDTLAGDCDDAEPLAAAGIVESCDGLDDDCDGAVDEPGASPLQCDSTPVLQAPVDNSASGSFIVHVERFRDAVDLTGVALWSDTQVGVSVPGGPLVNVHSILVRNWQGSSAGWITAGAVFTFPAGVTVLGWIADTTAGGTALRGTDDEFSVTGGSLAISGYGTAFEGASTDYAWKAFNQAGFHSQAGGGGADEARLLVQYDPDLLDSLAVDVSLATGTLQGLVSCDGALAGSGAFALELAASEPDLQDGDGDGSSACLGDCDDADPTVGPSAAEWCDLRDSDCDGDLLDGEPDWDGDGEPDCVDPPPPGDDDDDATADDDDATADDDDSAADDDDDSAGDDDDSAGDDDDSADDDDATANDDDDSADDDDDSADDDDDDASTPPAPPPGDGAPDCGCESRLGGRAGAPGAGLGLAIGLAAALRRRRISPRRRSARRR